MKTALSIAGSDPSGGAGIQADIKTMMANGVFAMSAITSLTAQNTMGVTGIFEVSEEFLAKQIDAVFCDIVPDAVKTGMLASAGLTQVVADRLSFFKAKNLVVDPVMVSTSGAKLLDDKALFVLTKQLLPLAHLVTPNIPEAQILADMQIKNKEDMQTAAKTIFDKFGCNVLLKGGHNVSDANDLLFDGKDVVWFLGKRIDNKNTHGTGCTLSSAIASNLAKGYEVSLAIKLAKEYISGALGAMLDLGKGSGPLDHAFDIDSRFTK